MEPKSAECGPDKLVVVLRRDLAPGRALNVCGHLTLGLTEAVARRHGGTAACRFTDYPDASGGSHAPISELALIVLSAKASWMTPFRDALIEAGQVHVDYTDLMTEGRYSDQQRAMAEVPAAHLAYLGVAAHGPVELLDPLTRRFSLWH